MSLLTKCDSRPGAILSVPPHMAAVSGALAHRVRASPSSTRRILYGILIGCTWLLTLAYSGGAGQAAESVLFVSTTGDDQAPGTKLQPLRSPARALILAGGGSTGITVIELQGGVYHLSETLVLGPEHNGLMVRSAAGETAILSGAAAPPRAWEDAGNSSWRLSGIASAPAALAVGDDLWPPARWPEQTLLVEGCDGLKLTLDRDLGVAVGTHARCLIAGDWMVSRTSLQVTGARTVRLDRDPTWPGSAWHRLAPGRALWLEAEVQANIPPGTWAYDPARQEVLTSAVVAPPRVVLPGLDTLVRMAGTAGHPLRNVTWQRVVMRDGGWSTGADAGGIQAGKVMFGATPALVSALPAAVLLAWAQDIRIERCQFGPSAAAGLAVGAGCRRIVVDACTFADLGGSGATIGWTATTAALVEDWPDVSWAPRAVRIERSRFSRCALLDWGSVGVAAWFAQDYVVRDNRFSDLSYSAISLGFRWDPGESSQRGGMVEGNLIDGVTRLLCDGGGIYTLGNQRGLLVRDNRIHGVERPAWAMGSPSTPLFFDQGSCGIVASGNRLEAPAGEAVRHNESLRSGILIDGPAASGAWEQAGVRAAGSGPGPSPSPSPGSAAAP